MKRSQALLKQQLEVDQYARSLDALRTYARKANDLAIVTAKKQQDNTLDRAKLARAMEDTLKHVIAKNSSLFSPFQDRFLAKLGTIVDFNNGGDVCDPWILVEGFRDVTYFQIRHDRAHNEIDVYSCIDVVDDTENALHTFVNASNGWKPCLDGECVCHDKRSDTSAFMRHIAQHPYAIAAVIEELNHTYDRFEEKPSQVLVELAKNKRTKKHKKDQKE